MSDYSKKMFLAYAEEDGFNCIEWNSLIIKAGNRVASVVKTDITLSIDEGLDQLIDEIY